jgi:hypothetical protein
MMYLPGTVHSWDGISVVASMLNKLSKVVSGYNSWWYDISDAGHFNDVFVDG